MTDETHMESHPNEPNGSRASRRLSEKGHKRVSRRKRNALKPPEQALLDRLATLEDDFARVAAVLDAGFLVRRVVVARIKHYYPGMDFTEIHERRARDQERLERKSKMTAKKLAGSYPASQTCSSTDSEDLSVGWGVSSDLAAISALEKYHAKSMEKRLRDVIAPLRGVKRLDSVIRDLDFWRERPELLLKHGIAFADVVARHDVVQSRARAKMAQRDNADFARLEALLAENPFADVGVTLVRDDSDPRITILCLDAGPYMNDMEEFLKAQVSWSLDGLLRALNVRHSTGRSENRFIAHMPPARVFDLYGGAVKVRNNIRAILNVAPGALRPVSLSDAARFCGIPEAAFRDMVEADLVPVAKVETFRKWGRALEAKRFDPGTLRDLQVMGVFIRFMAKRLRDASENRRKGAVAAKVTRARRDQIRETVKTEMRQARAMAVRGTGGLAEANNLELWTWAQRASRQAKTIQSKAAMLYGLKDDAILCLERAGALSVSFVDAGQSRLISKCEDHETGWFDIYELEGCRRCRFGLSHHYSLYSFALKAFPEANGLHMPYPTGLAAGLPPAGKLPKADHGRDIPFGRRLDEDEKAIFTAPQIEKEIRRLVGVIDEMPRDAVVV